MNLPVLETERLRLRPFAESDMAEIAPLIGAREVAATTLRIPHPFNEQHFQHFLEHMQGEKTPNFAITLREGGALIGGIGFRIAPEHQHAELGYWLAVPYWRKGYATEAGHAMLRYGFRDLKLYRIFASHFGHNPASGRVLLKLGMRYEGCQRGHLHKWDQFVDSEMYGMLRQEWEARE
jgi:ribosomal-protein-alanine N-acetyltransferase